MDINYLYRCYLVELGEAIAIISGQSIQELGTQLTLSFICKFNEDLGHPTCTCHMFYRFRCNYWRWKYYAQWDYFTKKKLSFSSRWSKCYNQNKWLLRFGWECTLWILTRWFENKFILIQKEKCFKVLMCTTIHSHPRNALDTLM